MTTFYQFNDLIKDYRSLLATICEKYTPDDFRLKYVKNMLDIMIRCRQYFHFERQFSQTKNSNYFPWFITFVFFPATLECIDKSLDLLRQHMSSWQFPHEYTRTVELLASMRSRLRHQQLYSDETGKVSLTTYRGHSFTLSYEKPVEFINAKLLFQILKDLGYLFAYQEHDRPDFALKHIEKNRLQSAL